MGFDSPFSYRRMKKPQIERFKAFLLVNFKHMRYSSAAMRNVYLNFNVKCLL